MITFDQEQAHFLNIAVARLAQQKVLSRRMANTNPATILHISALQTINRHRVAAQALLLTAGPQSNPLSVQDFRDNPRLPTLIDGFISQNTCYSVQKAGDPAADTDLISLLSLSRYCIAPSVTLDAGTFDDLARICHSQRNLIKLLQPHQADINLHHHSILAASKTSQEAVVVAYQPLVDRIASPDRQYGDMQLADRQQEARLGLIKAMEKFDHRRQNRFSSYATYYASVTVSRASLKQGYAIYEPELNHQIRNRARHQHPDTPPATPVPTSISLEASLESGDRNPSTRLLLSMVETDPEANPEIHAENNDLKEIVHQIMANALDDQERTILAMRFGINYPRPYSQYEVARSFGIRDSTVHNIEMQALQRFRRAAQHALAEYI